MPEFDDFITNTKAGKYISRPRSMLQACVDGNKMTHGDIILEFFIVKILICYFRDIFLIEKLVHVFILIIPSMYCSIPDCHRK